MGLYMEIGSLLYVESGKHAWSRAFREGLSLSEAVGLSPDPIFGRHPYVKRTFGHRETSSPGDDTARAATSNPPGGRNPNL